MKTINHYPIRRALAVLTAGLVFGSLLPVFAQTSPYYISNSYVHGTSAPFNAGGGVPAQSLITSQTYTATNCTLNWYGMQGWYTVMGATSVAGPWNPLTSVEATGYAWQTVLPIPATSNGYTFFQLSQANSFAGQGACSSCHGNKYTPWSQTAHASALSALTAIGMDSNPSCLVCHTVGFNQPTGYTNSTLTPYLANVGCENCHGPAGWHKNSDHSYILPAVSMDPAICGSCHQGSEHPTYDEYTTTNSFGLYPGFSHSHPSQSAATSAGCAFCHQANNRMVMLNENNDMLAGNPHPLTLFTGADATAWTATCATCHDPHSSNQVAQLRYPTFSTNFFTMATAFDTRSVVTTNVMGVVSTNTVNMNTVFDTLYNPNIQVCGQCHNTRGARWDGTAYGLVTNTVVGSPTNVIVYSNVYTTNTITQVFTNSSGVPYLTNTYTSVYVSGRTSSTVVVTPTNQVVGVAVYAPLIPYTNSGGTISYATNSSGYSRGPHATSQYNILIGEVDYDYASNGVPNATHPHSTAPNQCATCHVPNYSVNATTAVTGHSFQVDYYGCMTSCHSSYTADALTAKINNLQFIESNNIVRVASLLNQWALNETAGTLLTNYGPLAWEYTSPAGLGTTTSKYKAGPPSAYSAKLGTQPAGTNDDLQLQIPQDIRMARFDLYMAYNDQSIGVHNPTYVQALLDDAATRVSRQFTYANFSANTVAGFAPLTVKFSNLGAGITGYNWTFGDGNTATIANPTNVYITPGIYSVTFTATTASGSETLMKTNYINVLTPPTLSFVADNTNVTVGTTVNFTNTSINSANVFRWTWYPQYGVSGAPSVDEAGSSTGFSYTYTNTGTFSVSLRATCTGGASGNYNRIQATNTAFITVHN